MSITNKNIKITDIYKDTFKIHSESKLSEFENDLDVVSIEDFNSFVQDQSAIDESQNEAIESISSKVDNIELFKFPNATIIGEPTIQNGQVSGFSTMNYLQFPFILDLHNQAFQIDFCFTTATNVQTQQNILDSKFGIALAISGGKGLMAISSNGTSWNIGSVQGTMTIESNTTYYARLVWNGNQYMTLLSTDGVQYSMDMVLDSAQRPYPTTIFIGGCDTLETGHTPHPFLGTINLNKAYLSVMGNVIWAGMDDAGLATRLATNLNNIDETGIAKINEIVSAKYLGLNGGTLSGNLQIGDGQTTAARQTTAVRQVDGNARGASFYVNSDGTAAFFHKTYGDTNLGSPVNDAILKFDHNGLQFAKGATNRTTATEFKKVITEESAITMTATLEDGTEVAYTLYGVQN